VGEIFRVRLPCRPATGYEWRLKSVNRRIAAPAGPEKFQKDDSGLIGAGGVCVVPIKGVKPGRTKAVFVYRRSWEKVAPAKTFTVRIKVVAKTSR
ncbi:MAG: protease inhibitor I42 family protein, partial [Elusimicrobia bacterium]|nr:protease inhibitor I42 family protein [Elusimicrobiota bacterium]